MTAEQVNEFNEINRITNTQLGFNIKVLSWGISKRISTIFEDNPTLKIKVSGRKHKGYVLIKYVMGRDTYDIIYINNRNNEKLERDIDIYNDQLIDIIDQKIEKIDAYKY